MYIVQKKRPTHTHTPIHTHTSTHPHTHTHTHTHPHNHTHKTTHTLPHTPTQTQNHPHTHNHTHTTLCDVITPESDIQMVVGKYQNSIVVASKKSFKERQLLQKTIGFKSVPWWTGELTAMRKKLNAIRRRYQRTAQDSNLREIRKYRYLKEKRKYEANLRKATIQSWKQYCNSTVSTNRGTWYTSWHPAKLTAAAHFQP